MLKLGILVCRAFISIGELSRLIVSKGPLSSFHFEKTKKYISPPFLCQI